MEKKSAKKETKTSKVNTKVAEVAKAKKTTAAATTAENAHLPGQSCKMASCKREYRAKGYCATHYRMWRQGKFGRARFKTCKDFGCVRPMGMNRHGFCEEHFTNYYVKGMEQSKIPTVEKPAAKVEEKVAS